MLVGSHAGCKGRAYATIPFGTSGLDSATNATIGRGGDGLAKRHYHIVPSEVADNAANLLRKSWRPDVKSKGAVQVPTGLVELRGTRHADQP